LECFDLGDLEHEEWDNLNKWCFRGRGIGGEDQEAFLVLEYEPVKNCIMFVLRMVLEHSGMLKAQSMWHFKNLVLM